MAVSAWFDYDVYMNNKLAQVKTTDPSMTLEGLKAGLAKAGFEGPEGAQQHFLQYGAAEKVNPNALFNADEYITAKTVSYFKITDGKPTAAQVAEVTNGLTKSGFTAWSHYAQYGNSEGVEPSFKFVPATYCAAKATAMGAGVTGDDVMKAITGAGMTVLEHFMLYGGAGDQEVGVTYKAIAGGAENPFVDPTPPTPVDKPGNSFDLTRNIDNLTGTAGSDTFFAANIDGFKTLNAGDVINGNGGNDTLMIAANAGGENFAAAKVTGVANVVSFDSINVAGNADVKNVTLSGNAAQTINRLDQTVAFKNSTNSVNAVVSYTDANGKEDAATVNLSDADLGGLSVQGIETLTLNLTGRNANYGDLPTLDTAITLSSSSATKIITTGEGSVKLNATLFATGSPNNTISNQLVAGKLTDLDFSANKGGTSLKLDYAAFKSDVVTVKGGEGADSVTAVATGATNALATTSTAAIKFDVNMGAGNDTFEVVTGVHKDAKFDGAEGADTLVLNNFASGVLDATVGKQFVNFEAVDLKGTTYYTHGFIKGIENVNVLGGATIEIDGFTTVGIKGDVTTKLDIKGSGVGDFTFDNGLAGRGAGSGVDVTALDVEVQVLNLHSNGNVSDNNEVTLGTAASLKSIVIDGDQAFSLNTSGAVATLKTVDGSSATGYLTLDLDIAKAAAAGAEGVKITGGNGGNEITGTLLNDTIIGGDGDDTILASSGTANTAAAYGYDKMSGGLGTDTFVVKGANLAALASATTFAEGDMGRMTEITDFSKGEKIDFESVTNGTIAVGQKNMTSLSVTKVNSLTELASKIAFQANGGTNTSVANKLMAYVYVGDTYLVASDAADLASNVGNDIVVKLTGVVLDSDGTTDANGVFTW